VAQRNGRSGRTGPIFDDDGHIVRVSIHRNNISNGKRPKLSFVEAKSEYRYFFERNISASYITRPDGSILACNEAFVKLFGFRSVQEALNANIQTIYSDVQDRSRFLGLLQKKNI